MFLVLVLVLVGIWLDLALYQGGAGVAETETGGAQRAGRLRLQRRKFGIPAFREVRAEGWSELS